MRMIAGIALLCCLFVVPMTLSAGTEDEAFHLVSERMVQVKWEKTSVVEVDINCDGNTDYVFLGKTERGITVSVVVGPITAKSRIESYDFFVGKQSQDSLCTLPAKLKTESLDYDPDEAVGKLPGFHRSKSCVAFVVADEACDSFHFYWNHQLGALAWWRL